MVIELHCDVEDLGQIRFGFSPVWEAVTSLRTLSMGSGVGTHARWLRQVHLHLGGVDLGLLTAVVRPAGYLPDFLHPVPERSADFGSELARIATTDPRLVAAELSHLATHPQAQQGPDREQRAETLDVLAADPAAGLARITTELDRYWHTAIAPYWPRIHALLDADLTYRLQELAAGGLRRLFATLHPLVSFDGASLRIVKYYDGHADLRQRGLVLVPCAFAWPEVLVRTADPQPVVSYARADSVGSGTLQPPFTIPLPVCSAAAVQPCSPNSTCPCRPPNWPANSS